jgi:hypothetical protein
VQRLLYRCDVGLFVRLYRKFCIMLWKTHRHMYSKVVMPRQRHLLELVLIGFVHGFSSIILTRARRKSESILSYGELFQRSNRQNLPKRQVQ